MADIKVTSTSRQPATRAGLTWPLSSNLVLGALPTATSCARLHARNVMYEWGLADAAETVELVVSELLTNAILALTHPDGRPRYEYGAGLPGIYLRLSSDRVHLLIEVRDANPRVPTPKIAGLNDESGRGLMLIDALCERWGWYAEQDGSSGKVVWAEVSAG